MSGKIKNKNDENKNKKESNDQLRIIATINKEYLSFRQFQELKISKLRTNLYEVNSMTGLMHWNEIKIISCCNCDRGKIKKILNLVNWLCFSFSQMSSFRYKTKTFGGYICIYASLKRNYRQYNSFPQVIYLFSALPYQNCQQFYQ